MSLKAAQCSLATLKQRATSSKSVPGWSNYVAEKHRKTILGTMFGKKKITLLVAEIFEIRCITCKDYHKAVKFVKTNKMEVIAKKTMSIIIRREI